MGDWKKTLANKIPKVTRKQLFYLIILVGVMIAIIFVPISMKFGAFTCDKRSMKAAKK